MEEAATKPSEDEIKFDETEHRRDMVSCTGTKTSSEKKIQKYKWYCGNCKVVEFIV